MKEFNITMTAISKKEFPIRAESRDEALLLVEAIRENTGLLDFTDEDVDSMAVGCEEPCGGVCETCGNACESCGGCQCLRPDCAHPDRDCKYHCPACGGCMCGGDNVDDKDEDECPCFRQVKDCPALRGGHS